MPSHRFIFLLSNYRLKLHSIICCLRSLQRCSENLLILTIHFNKHQQLLHLSQFPDYILLQNFRQSHLTILHLLVLHQYLIAISIFFFFLKESISNFSPLALRELAYYPLFCLGKSDYLVKRLLIVSSLNRKIEFLKSQYLKALFDSLA